MAIGTISVYTNPYTMTVSDNITVSADVTKLSYEVTTNPVYSKYVRHSATANDDVAYSISTKIGQPGTFKVAVGIKASFGYNGSHSSPANSHYRLKLRAKTSMGNIIFYDTGDVTGYSQPFYSNMRTNASPSNTTWINLGTFDVELPTGSVTFEALISMYQVNNKHCYTAMNGMQLNLKRV